MKRLWGVSLGLIGICSLHADTNLFRTPTGYLWAGTTLTLQAQVSHDSLVASSNSVQVRVSKIIHWQTLVDAPTGATVSSGSAVFSSRVVNLGNAYDRLSFEVWRTELADPVWTVRLYENSNGDGQISGSTLIASLGSGGQGRLIAPGDSMQYLVQATPPSSSVLTDGVWVSVTYNTSVPSRTNQLLGEFVAGVYRTVGVHSRTFSYSGTMIHTAPVLAQSRLFWIGTYPDTNRSMLFYTPNSVTDSGSTLNSNRQVYGRALNNFVPTGFSVTLGTSWFTGLGNNLIRIDLQRVLANDTSADPYTVITLPNARPRLDLAPAVYNNRLYVAGDDNRLHVIRADGSWATQSARASTTVGNFSSAPLVVGRSLYIGTDRGYILRFDLTTGGIAQSRQVATNMPIRSLAVTRDRRLVLAQVGDTRLLGLLSSNLTTYYYYNPSQPLVSQLTYHWNTDTVLFMTRDGYLYALNAQTGGLRPYYPQQIWSGQPLQRATLTVMRQQERKADYVYALAQQATANGGTQGRFAMITLLNPYNRYEVGESQMYTASDYLPWLTFTGDQSYSFCLITARNHAQTRGFITAIALR